MFSRLKKKMKGTRFEPREDMLQNATVHLYSMERIKVLELQDSTLKGIRVSHMQVSNCEGD